jgi:hypothetical protein
MIKQNFVNQFKNTRRLVKLQSGKKSGKTAGTMKKSLADRRPWKKAEPEKKTKGER